MKRLLTLAAMFLCCLAATFAQFSGSGSGTESDPYLILNPVQLNQLRNFLNQRDVYFKLMADIDLAEFLEDENPSQGWQPIGTKSAPFRGILDGNGKTISNLWIKRSNNDCVGLFGYMKIATIKNLTLSDVSINGNNNVGGFSGFGEACNISNCNLSGSIQGGSSVGGYFGVVDYCSLQDNFSSADVVGKGDYVGGFVGKAYDDYRKEIVNCRVNNNVIKGNNYVGGLLGYMMEGNISSCYAYTNICGFDCTGGLIGFGIQNVYISHCGFAGSIRGNDCVGGIMGKGDSNNRPISVSNSFSIGDIISSGSYVGGITGRCDSYFYQSRISCYHNGSIQGSSYVGGITGYGGSVSNCYSISQISGIKKVGGLAGYLVHYGSTGKGGGITSSVAINSSVAATEDDVARIAVSNILPENGSESENKSYNRTIVISRGIAQDVIDNNQNGTGVSATTLKLKATYVAMGWDFGEIWEMQETECYPYFIWQTAPPVITSQVSAGATTISGKCIDGGTITLDVDGSTQQMVSYGNEFSFTVSPLQTGHEVRVWAKAEGKEQSYYATEIVASLGTGKENDPYQVYTASDLTNAYRKGYYKLMNDIDLTDYINQNSPSEGWKSIGRDGSETIHFDGDGHKITGLWCNTTRDNTGLFSCFANGTIKNLKVETANGKQVKGGANTGILIGKMINGTIENCRVSGTVADGTPVGGLVGLFDGGKISLSQASVTINTTNGSSYVGGLAGEVTGGEIDQCVTLGTITATGNGSYVGGLVGKNSATVTNCYSNAVVTSTYNAAGLIAYNYNVVDKCYATGDIFSRNYGAGIIGYNDGANAVVKNCVAMNNKIDVTFESQSAQSGGYGQRIIGGIKNGAPAPELNNYALKSMQVSVNNKAQKVYDDIMNGVGKLGPDLVSASTYQTLGWDFSTIWNIAEGESYPSLKNNAASVISPVFVVPEITADDKTRKYGEANPELTYTVNADLIGTPQLSTTATKTSPVGVYDIIVERGTVEGNYTSKNGKLSVTKAPLTISGGTYTIKQGEALPTFVASYSGFMNNETESVLTKKPVLTTTATSGSAPGDYDVTVSGAEAQNYDISYTKGKLTITKADPVTITAKSYTRVYGEANPTFEYTSSGAALTGTPQISCEATATSPVGTYDIIVSQGSVSNYNVTYVKGTLTITKAPLTVTAKSYTVKQGEAMPTFEATYSGFKNNETSNVLSKQPTFSCSATPTSAPGAYDINVSGATATNYDISYVKGTLTLTAGTFKLTYMVDGKVYKTYEIEYGTKITPEAAPTKEGYTFSGWSNIPATMPANDVTVTGKFTVNKYKLTYIVDGVEYKSYQIEYGASITPEAAPTKEGYTFSGWSKIPSTMPANDVTVTGSFTVNKYKLTYMVDGDVYKTYEIEYGTRITPEPAPTKEGYSFSGWSNIPSTMPARDVTVTGTFSRGTYTLTYIVDGVTYKTVSYNYGETITPEAEPTKEGYTFSGWSYIPSTMPAEDVTVTGTFSVNKYTLTYLVDGSVYRSYSVEYGTRITPETEPTREGYTFSGWSNIPSTMPAHDVEVTGTFIQVVFIINDVTYEITGNGEVTITGGDKKGEVTIESTVKINGQTYRVTGIADNAFKNNQDITSLTIPEGILTIGDNAFNGCTRLIVINIEKDVHIIGDKAFANVGTAGARTRSEASTITVNCYTESVPQTASNAFENTPIETGTLFVEDNLKNAFKSTSPWSRFGKIIGFEEAAGINSIMIGTEDAWIFDMQGNRLDNVRKGVNIIRTRDGNTKKIVVK